MNAESHADERLVIWDKLSLGEYSIDNFSASGRYSEFYVDIRHKNQSRRFTLVCDERSIIQMVDESFMFNWHSATFDKRPELRKSILFVENSILLHKINAAKNKKDNSYRVHLSFSTYDDVIDILSPFEPKISEIS